MGESDTAQAMELVRALCEVLDKTTHQLAWLEQRGARLGAFALRPDVSGAQAHINRLQRRYLNGNRHPSRQLTQQASTRAP